MTPEPGFATAGRIEAAASRHSPVRPDASARDARLQLLRCCVGGGTGSAASSACYSSTLVINVSSILMSRPS
jgi:hypothetical protein